MSVVSVEETPSSWDLHRLVFRILRGPEWLSIDEATGLMSGRAARVGKAEVVITATLEEEQHRLDEETPKRGIEEGVFSGTVAVGNGIQHHVI